MFRSLYDTDKVKIAITHTVQYRRSAFSINVVSTLQVYVRALETTKRYRAIPIIFSMNNINLNKSDLAY